MAAFGAEDELAQGFTAPPLEARPWTYWMWRNGNITKAGITADLEALHRIGIRGVLIMNLGARETMVRRVIFMTPEWRDMVRHAVAEAARLGMHVDMNNDDGWNCGGPWITPEQAMQTLTWSETRVVGPNRFSGTLPQPPTKLDFYREVAVLAIPAAPRL